MKDWGAVWSVEEHGGGGGAVWRWRRPTECVTREHQALQVHRTDTRVPGSRCWGRPGAEGKVTGGRKQALGVRKQVYRVRKQVSGRVC